VSKRTGTSKRYPAVIAAPAGGMFEGGNVTTPVVVSTVKIASRGLLDPCYRHAERALDRFHNVPRIRRERRNVCFHQPECRLRIVALPYCLIERRHRCAGRTGRIVAAVAPAEPRRQLC
jgi:hypothetical protein